MTKDREVEEATDSFGGHGVVTGPPTHYQSTFDDQGRPMVFAPLLVGDSSLIGGVLPKGWDDMFWDWRPRFDPKGQWVYLTAEAKQAEWKAAKAEAETVAQEFQTPWGFIQLDAASLAAIRARVQRLMLPGAPTSISWTMKDNSQAIISSEDFVELGIQIEDYLDGLHRKLQQDRITIFSGLKKEA